MSTSGGQTDGGRTTADGIGDGRTRGDSLEALSTGDWMRGELRRRVVKLLEVWQPLCGIGDTEELATQLVNMVWDWLMGNAQLMILVGRYADPGLRNRPDVSELAGKE